MAPSPPASGQQGERQPGVAARGEDHLLLQPSTRDTYELGETIELLVEFHRAVTVSGSPLLALTIGTQTRHAVYSMSWRDGRFLQFSYAVQEYDRDEDGIGIPANALTTGGGTITAVDGAADADLRHATEPPWHGGKVDGSPDHATGCERHLLYLLSRAR